MKAAARIAPMTQVRWAKLGFSFMASSARIMVIAG